MLKPIVPRAVERYKAMFESPGLHLPENMPVDEPGKAVTGYIDSHNVLNPATCRDNKPRCTRLEYRSNGMTSHLFSEDGGKPAIAAADDMTCGLSRMYEVLSGMTGRPVKARAFRTTEEARGSGFLRKTTPRNRGKIHA